MDTVTILGTRGSMPRTGAEFARYGGDTTCVLLKLAGETILLDAGTGLMNCDLPEASEKSVYLLLSHMHADHLLGLPLSPLLLKEGNRIEAYVRSRGGLEGEATVDRLFSPPLWPVRIGELPARIRFRELMETLRLGNVTVETMEGCHPGGVTLMKLRSGGKSVVFLPDCELTETLFPLAAEFAKGCSLLLCDGQYSEEEWARRSGFGHSSWSRAIQLGLACGAERIRIIHHDPYRTDPMLEEAGSRFSALHPDCSFALAREEVKL